ncbi:autotransporter outer membrane beta-barrel domain-containing protein [Parasutterella secunda]|uniref:autotransporter outer membrane beta-barrel domain-containing protein n=1 Tax=Parasutterella secunda TaxID=626947 RepID=UPI0025A47967|nr:autotransporter outer membrane beta-barrel domain-containing protein [Parasutterella secunda]MDM8225963.1 autotransporter outer membrane beta-barrel domain-containing protein [Parasutterella secunda]
MNNITPPQKTIHSKYPTFLKFSAIALVINSLFSTAGYSKVLSLDGSHFQTNNDNGNKVYTITREDQLGNLSLTLPSSSQKYVLTAESDSIAVDKVTSTVIKITGSKKYSDENSSTIEIGKPMIIGNNNANQTQTVNSSSLISFDDGYDSYVKAGFSTGSIHFQNITLKSSSDSVSGIIDATFSGWPYRFGLDFKIDGALTFDNISYISDENENKNKNKHLINLSYNKEDNVINLKVTGSTQINNTTSNSFVRSFNATAELNDVTVKGSHFNTFLDLSGGLFKANDISISNTEIQQLVDARKNNFRVNSISYDGSSEGTFLSEEMNFVNFTDSSITINKKLSIQNLNFSANEGTSAHLIEFANSSKISIGNSLTGPDEYAIDLQNIDFYANTQVYQKYEEPIALVSFHENEYGYENENEKEKININGLRVNGITISHQADRFADEWTEPSVLQFWNQGDKDTANVGYLGNVWIGNVTFKNKTSTNDVKLFNTSAVQLYNSSIRLKQLTINGISAESSAESETKIDQKLNGLDLYNSSLSVGSIRIEGLEANDAEAYGIFEDALLSKYASSINGSKEIYISEIHSNSNNAYGIFSNSGYLTLNSDETESQEQNIQIIQIKSISGINAYGFRINDADKTSMNSGALLVQDITASGSNGTAAALSINTKNNNGAFKFKAPSLSASNIEASEGQAYGVEYSDPDGQSLKIDIDDINIKQISGSNASGINFISSVDLSANKESSLDSKTVDISEISAPNGTATGIRLYKKYYKGSLVSNFETVSISDISGSSAYALNISGDNNLVTIGSLNTWNIHSNSLETASNSDAGNPQEIIINADDYAEVHIQNSAFLIMDPLGTGGSYTPTYQGSHLHQSSGENPIKSFALRATGGAKITIGVDESSVLTQDQGPVDNNILIVGNIVAGKGGHEDAGDIKIAASGSASGVYGDIFAGNDGEINLKLSDGAVLEGQLDDYHELALTENKDRVFRNDAFFDENGNQLEITNSGKISLTLDDSKWIAHGRSFVNEIQFGEKGGIIDLTQTPNGSISANTVSGQGTFRLVLGSNQLENVESDMLYVQNVSETTHFNIEVILGDDVQHVTDLKDLRFATIKNYEGKADELFSSVTIQDQGFNNWNLSIANEDFSSEDTDNERFNGTGDGKGEYKPGENAIDAIYGEETAEGETSQNYFISGGNSSLSDAGSALLATARGTYWTSVEIDRLTNRMGDARYANNGEDGLWIRLRQSRLGTDTGEGDFKSDNTVYQVGYDHAFQHDGGRQLVGIAFDYMDTDLDYKGISGEGNTDRYGITAYTTWLADNGFYVDVVGKWGRLDNDFDIINGSVGRVKADYDNNMWAISAEFGKKLSNPKTGMFIEPNAQLQYTMVTDAQYSTNQGTRVDQDRIDSVIARAGVRIGRAFGETQSNTIYAKADLFREFFGEQKIHVKDVTTHVEGDTITVQNKGFWFDVGGGFQAQLGKSTYAYADVEYRWGDDLDKSWLVNAGARFEF